MANNEGTPGIAVTPLVDGKAADSGNPIPVVIVSGSTADIKFARVEPTANGDNQVVPAVVGKKIRVISWILDNGGDTPDWFFYSDNNAAPISVTATAALGGDNYAAEGLFETVAGEELGINMSAATAGATLTVTYKEI